MQEAVKAMDKQREKLIELINKGQTEYYNSFGNNGIRHNEYIADYLLANGVIVPPYNVRDKFYRVVKRWHGKTSTWERKIETFIVSIISYNGEEIILENDSEEYIWLSDIGKTVFLSKEEAEKALEERKDK